jgi:hypothetical protein
MFARNHKYSSPVENGPTVPAIETLEKMARTFEIPHYQLLMAAQPPRIAKSNQTEVL